MCKLAELRIPAEAWAAAAPPYMVPPGDHALPGAYIALRGQMCRGHLLAGPVGTPDDSRHPGWIDLGPVDDLPDPKRSMTRLVWSAWQDQVGWG